MTRLHEAIVVLIAATAPVFFGACGGDDSSDGAPEDAGGFAGFGATAGSGGFGAFGGSLPSGGTGGVAGAGGSGGALTTGGSPGVDAGADAGPQCPYTGTPVDPAAFPECTLCENAHCVPTSLVPADTVDQLADCDTTSKCVPDDFIVTAGTFLLETCRSLENAEGRCVPLCLPQVAAQAGYLPQDVCAADERCAPCYDPTTGEPTGACGVSCDPGATEPPVTFDKCCGGLGSCVPSSLVPAEQRSSLGSDSCTDAMQLCAPDSFVSGMPLDCRSLNNAEGRCVPACLPAVASLASSLPVDVCATGEVCAPCYHPLTGEPTGSCTVNGDMPTEGPVTFPGCCHDLGSCVPSTLVPTAQVDFLGTDSCTASGALCAPNDLADSTFVPPTCDSVNGAEGRCLPDCLPDVAAQASMLPAAGCAEFHLCVPCYNPLSGDPTGACTLNGDMPTEPPVTFPACCGGLGSCVPSTLVPVEQQSLLGADTCTGTGELCAPNNLADPTFIPQACDSVGSFEGRCLPACLPDIEAQASVLPQATCPAGHLCAPCYDPLTGADTGACTLNGDMPQDPAGTFPECCGGIGSCVPMSLVPVDQRSLLGQDTCTDATALCAPDELADPSFIPSSCNSVGGFEGRCLPSCLPDVQAQASRLPQDSCPSTHLCAPCYDPITGADTGACHQNGDLPAELPSTFEDCCGGIGSCVPTALVPTSQQSLLSQDTCTDAGTLCAPDELTDSSFQPPTCNSISGFEGRCLAACLPDIAAQADRLPQDTCASTHLCAPCYDPITGGDTQACRLNDDAPVEPPSTFAECCGGLGVCVPGTLVPPEQQALLSADTCTNAGDLCAPELIAADPTATPPVCHTFQPQNREGRCLPACLPDLQARSAQLLQETCAAGELCAPCYDPVVGGSTGACEINDDAPLEPDPGPFVECGALLIICPFCPPGEGRCVPPHLVDPTQAGLLLPSAACQQGEICAPCVNPLDGMPTGACPP